MSGEVIVGIDEAGRGPLAGPVAVGVVALPRGLDVRKEFPGVADSKKLSEKKREEIFTLLEARAAQGSARFRVSFSPAASIDAQGITRAVSRALTRALSDLSLDPQTTYIFLDGLLVAPRRYIKQETIVKGDDRVPIISLASIAAKVMRDRLMKEYDTMYPLYGFARHKGYGTAAHRLAIEQNGLCPLHRRTFIRGLTQT